MLLVVQRAIRKYMRLNGWAWFRLWIRVRPMLYQTRIEDEIKVRAFPPTLTSRTVRECDKRMDPWIYKGAVGKKEPNGRTRNGAIKKAPAVTGDK